MIVACVYLIPLFCNTRANLVSHAIGFYGEAMGYVYGGRDDRNNKVGSMIIVIVAAMLTWVISFLIIRAISRYTEFASR